MKLFNFLSRLKKTKQLVRMTVVGDGAVGKTTLVQAMLRRTSNHTKNTSLDYHLDDKKITRTPFMEIETWTYGDLRFQCYDLAGQRIPGGHPLDLLQEQVIRSIDIYIFVFSIDRYKSFENLNNWIQLMDLQTKSRNGSKGFILVGNKIDLERNVSHELINTMVGINKYFQTYVETCSLDGEGIDSLLNEIVGMGKKLLNAHD
ncbi:MAG: GTPase domain-containing protein [Promethearchaeota archaeon]